VNFSQVRAGEKTAFPEIKKNTQPEQKIKKRDPFIFITQKPIFTSRKNSEFYKNYFNSFLLIFELSEFKISNIKIHKVTLKNVQRSIFNSKKRISFI